MSWQLRELTQRDTPRLAELELELFPEEDPWPASAFAAEIGQPHTFYVGVCSEEEPHYLVGYAGLAVLGPPSEPECEVHTIGVDPEFQGHGLGRLLLSNILAVADSLAAPIFLEVRTDNYPAINLYESTGFEKLGIRKNYYRPSGADAFCMKRPAQSPCPPPRRKD
ncbi:ribosomal protein S18-alanine N-acetyltransferase [Corynebacterium poyangense]|uniref:Ribosomal protein S18-alanine N-acetyltransferase n=1 Tax=Corynebacterium poyangense TaxID=2684405 RepID=A0A7H0SM98_9CORY|nr:ribosomal protein S18-alanine N-acetyltransferase [Corynebacterium poyangense]QNQ89673.1 ribosomal protein S18-alanine N-acetyltransferase [Corynebacterium poyangense]